MQNHHSPWLHWRGALPANLALLAAYLVCGRLGLMLALPPGYATPLFLPAGLALAALGVGGARLLPAVGAGALLLNLLAPHPSSSAPLGGAAVLAALVAAGAAMLQAWAGARLYRRWVDPAIGCGRDVIGFLLLAPVVCCISPSLSLAGLAALGVVARASLGANWLTWWLGDTIGVLLAAPLAWIAFGRPRALWRRRRWLVGLPLLLSMAAFVAIYLQTSRWEETQQMQTFRLKAQQAGDLLQAQFSEHERFVSVMSKALNDPRRQWSALNFSELAHGYLDTRPELLSLVWLQPVDDAGRDAFEKWGRQANGAGFEIRAGGLGADLLRAPQRPRYMVPTFIEPAPGRRLLGFDFLSEPVRAGAVAKALASGQPTASAALALFNAQRQPRGKLGILLMQSVYPAGQPQQVIGILMISLQLESYLGRVLAQVDFPELRAKFEDVGDSARPLTLQDALGRAAAARDFQKILHFGGRRYRLTLAPSAAYLQQHRGWQSWTVLTCGLLLSGLLGGMMLLISGERARIQAQVQDSTARLREREARLQAILDHAADAILTVAEDGMLVSANPAAALLFGYPPESMSGLPLEQLLPDAEGGPALLRRLAAPPHPAHSPHATPTGHSVHELSGRNSAAGAFPLSISVSRVDLPDERLFVCIAHDLTEQRRAQEHIHRLAHHDPLTGLDNRFSLHLRLEHLLAQARRSQGACALLFIDLDHFKKINDSHGHQTGDLLLVAVAGRLRALLREADAIARLGGDEFIVASADPRTPEEVAHLAQRVVEALAQPYFLDGKTLHSGASVGISLFPADGADAATLLRHADTALYAAKGWGRGNFQFFSSAMNAAAHERLQLENRLWLAFEQGEFEVLLQPQVCLASARIIGAEALLRWHHPELGMVGPDRFIPIAEESGLILALGDWVLQRAAELLGEWRRAGLDRLRLAVNLSARQCQGDGLLAQLDRLLAAGGIDPALLELEITETAAMQDPEHSRGLLRELRARGIRVAIDDFGTGYSSLSYLKLFAIDRIKIDRGFVKDIETDPNDAVIVAATIGLAHALGLGVVAEGVETAAQRAFLRAHDCDEAQGYLFGRPMPAAQFLALALAEAAPPERGGADLRRQRDQHLAL